MPKVCSIDGITPVVDPSAFVHPSAVLHGCTIGRGALVGMNSVGNDNAEIGWMRSNVGLYQRLAQRSAHSMRLVDALPAMEPGRGRIGVPGSIPLSEPKKLQ